MTVLSHPPPASFDIKGENVWLGKEYALPATISFHAVLKGNHDQIIPVFSQTKAVWGRPGCDALTYYLAADRSDYSFRFNGYDLKNSPTQHRRMLAIPGTSYRFECTITSTSAEYSIDGLKYATVTYPIGSVPLKGFFGFFVYGQSTTATVRNAVAFGNEEFAMGGNIVNLQRNDALYFCISQNVSGTFHLSPSSTLQTNHRPPWTKGKWAPCGINANVIVAEYTFPNTSTVQKNRGYNWKTMILWDDSTVSHQVEDFKDITLLTESLLTFKREMLKNPFPNPSPQTMALSQASPIMKFVSANGAITNATAAPPPAEFTNERLIALIDNALRHSSLI